MVYGFDPYDLIKEDPLHTAVLLSQVSTLNDEREVEGAACRCSDAAMATWSHSWTSPSPYPNKPFASLNFLSTPANIRRLPKLPPNLSQFLHFVPLSFPPGSTVDIPADKIEHLKTACDALQHPIRDFVSEKHPNWIVGDFFYHWAADIAQEFEIPIILYQILCATTSLFFFLTGDQEKKESHHHMTVAQTESNVAYKDHEASAMHDVFHGVNASGVPDGARFARLLAA